MWEIKKHLKAIAISAGILATLLLVVAAIVIPIVLPILISLVGGISGLFVMLLYLQTQGDDGGTSGTSGMRSSDHGGGRLQGSASTSTKSGLSGAHVRAGFGPGGSPLSAPHNAAGQLPEADRARMR